MAGLSEQTPAAPETLDEQLRVRERDAKFALAAKAKRERVEAAKREKELGRIDTIMPRPPGARDDAWRAEAAAGRVPLEEGDPSPDAIARAASLVPRRFESATFDTYEPRTPSQQAALDVVRTWLLKARNGRGPMLALIGMQGTGKSHLLYAVANALIADREAIYSRPWYRLADELRYGGQSPFLAGKTLEAPEVRAMLWKQKIVLLDEVRPTASTAFDDTELAKFACHSYDSRIAVLLTTNVSPLAEVMGPPAASRFTQLVIDGPDWRQS